MTSEYKKTLYEWAARQLEEGAVVTDVRLEYNEGYRYSSYTFEDPSFRVEISYKVGEWAVHTFLGEDTEVANIGMGELLSGLFAIAEKESGDVEEG